MIELNVCSRSDESDEVVMIYGEDLNDSKSFDKSFAVVNVQKMTRRKKVKRVCDVICIFDVKRQVNDFELSEIYIKYHFLFLFDN